MAEQAEVTLDDTKAMLEVLTGEKSIEESLNLAVADNDTPAKGESENDDSATVKDTEQSADNDKAEDNTTATPVVLTKDNKHTLPFSVVEGLRKQVKELSTQLQDAKNNEQAEVELAKLPEYSADDLAVIKEEMPEIAQALEVLTAEREKLAGEIKDLRTNQNATQDNNARTEAEAVQSTIDSIPKLAHIQATDPVKWQEAVAIDQKLAVLPENNDLSLADRFSKALSVVESIYGDIILPGDAVKAETTPAQPVTSPGADTLLDAKTESKEQPANPKPLPPAPEAPNSLSDLPAGSPPIHDPLAALAGKTPMTIIDNFNGKTPEQIENMVNNLI